MRRGHTLGLALVLHFCSVGALIGARTSIDIIFLGTYPAAWLPGYYLGQAAAVVVLSALATPLVRTGSPALNARILVVGGVGAIVGAVTIAVGLPGAPFVTCLWLAALAIQISIVAWNVAGDAFDLRTFKHVSRRLTIAGTLGALSMGLATPLLLGQSRHGLLAAMVAMILIAAAMVRRLPHARAAPRRANPKKVSALQYPLFTAVSAAVFLLTIVDTLVDYALKAEVSAAFAGGGIGEFMGPFYAVSAGLTLTLQTFVAAPLLQRGGVAGLMGALPAWTLAAGAGVLCSPGLWSSAALRMGQQATHYGFFNMGRELAVSPLPSTIRRSGKLLVKGVVTPVGVVTASVVLLLLRDTVDLRVVAGAVVLLSLGCVAIVGGTRRGYETALEDAIRTRRVGIAADEVLPHAVRGLARRALLSDDADTVVFGLELLETRGGRGTLPGPVVRRLNADAASIRAGVVRAVVAAADTRSTRHLLTRLTREPDPAVRWELLRALAVLAPHAALRPAADLIGSAAPIVRAGAALVLLAAGDRDESSAGTRQLRVLARDADPDARRVAALAIGSQNSVDLETELGLLVDDACIDVQVAALRAIGRTRTVALAHAVASLLGTGLLGHYASRALLRMGDHAIPVLLDTVSRGDYAASRSALATLSRLPGVAVERALTRLANELDPAREALLAQEVSARARRCTLSEPLYRTAREQAVAEAHAVQTLTRAIAQAREGGGTRPTSSPLHAAPAEVVVELQARRDLAEDRMLHWLAVCTDPARVLDVIPSLRGIAATPAARGTTIELLDSLIGDAKLRVALDALEATAHDDRDVTDDLRALADPWLSLILPRRTAEVSVNTPLERTLLLRKVDIFHDLPAEALLAISEMLEPREMARGELIFRQGDPPDGIYIVAGGAVTVGRRTDDHVRREIELTELTYFGELGVLDNKPRSADITCGRDGVLLFLDRADFQRITDDLPEVLRNIIRKLLPMARAGMAMMAENPARAPRRR
ncbi:MAG: cyclic nucleotide-binding domain-containing protein [Myxococcota bacterium]